MSTNSTPSIAEATDIRDIAPPVTIPGYEWLWWVAAALVLIGAVIGLLVYILTRRRQLAIPPVIPPHVRAKEQLQAALLKIGQPKPFVIAVSDALRTYLEARFDFRAPERTTEEFLNDLQRTDRLTREQKDSLGQFLQNCDLVKFARYEPGEAELRDLHHSAVRLVEETEPHPESAAAAPDSSLKK